MDQENTKINLEKVMEKARKLMALSERAGTPEEAANAAEKLQSMLLKYDLDLSKIQDLPKDEFTSTEYEMPEANLTMRGWAANLYAGIAKANQCEAIILSVGNKQAPKMGVVGRKHHIEVVNYMYQYLFHTLVGLSEDSCKAAGVTGTEKMRYKTAFCYGAAGVIRERLLEAKKKAQAECTDVNALVVCEEKAVGEFYRKQYPSTKKVTRKIMSRNGHTAGKIAGAQVRLRSGVTGNNQRSLG